MKKAFLAVAALMIASAVYAGNEGMVAEQAAKFNENLNGKQAAATTNLKADLAKVKKTALTSVSVDKKSEKAAVPAKLSKSGMDNEKAEGSALSSLALPILGAGLGALYGMSQGLALPGIAGYALGGALIGLFGPLVLGLAVVALVAVAAIAMGRR